MSKPATCLPVGKKRKPRSRTVEVRNDQIVIERDRDMFCFWPRYTRGGYVQATPTQLRNLCIACAEMLGVPKEKITGVLDE